MNERKDEKNTLFFYENNVNDNKKLRWNAKRFSSTPTLFSRICVCFGCYFEKIESVCIHWQLGSDWLQFVSWASKIQLCTFPLPRFIYFFWSLMFEWWMRNFVRKQISKWEMKTKYRSIYACSGGIARAHAHSLARHVQWIWMWSENDHQSHTKMDRFTQFICYHFADNGMWCSLCVCVYICCSYCCCWCCCCGAPALVSFLHF